MSHIFLNIVAVLYYSVNLFYTVKLEDPIYYNRDAWIALIRQVRLDFLHKYSMILIFH